MMETRQKWWRNWKFNFTQYSRQRLFVSICPSATPVFEALSFFCRWRRKKKRKEIKPWCCWDEKAKCRSGTVFQTIVKRRGKKINWGRRKCQRRSENLVGKEGRIHRGQLSVFSFLCLLSHRCVMSRLLGKSAFLLFLFVPFEPRFHEQFTQPYLQQAKLLTLERLAHV